MTTEWLLLLLVMLMSLSPSVDSQSTTDDETCNDGGLMNKLQKDIEKILDSQRQLFQRLGNLQ